MALWVSAFEILAHDGRADLGKVLTLLNSVAWQDKTLQVLDREVHFREKTILTNAAGTVYEVLYRVRNAFLHGNPVTAETLSMPHCGKHVLQFAAPLFRLALTAYLELKFPDAMPDPHEDPNGAGRYIADHMEFVGPQRLAEKAILVADTDADPDDR